MTSAQVDDMPAEMQSARVKFADFTLLAKLRWSSQQLVAAMRLFHQATGHFRRDNLQVLLLPACVACGGMTRALRPELQCRCLVMSVLPTWSLSIGTTAPLHHCTRHWTGA